MGSAGSCILMSSLARRTVHFLRIYVHSGHRPILKDIAPAQLIVYKNMESFDRRLTEEDKELPLKSSYPLRTLGKTEEEGTIVAVVNAPAHSETLKPGIMFFETLLMINCIIYRRFQC